ncbi:hypothetical protein Tco_0850474 [Tanacetum coccineum]
MIPLLHNVTVPPSTGNFSIPCAVDGMAWIFLIPGLSIIPLCWDGDLTTMKFIHAEVECPSSPIFTSKDIWPSGQMVSPLNPVSPPQSGKDIVCLRGETLDNEVWKVIQNGNSKKRVTKGKDGVYRVLPPATQEEQFADEKERKARTLLMAVPKDHLRRFHGMDDAKEIWAAIKTHLVLIKFEKDEKLKKYTKNKKKMKAVKDKDALQKIVDSSDGELGAVSDHSVNDDPIHDHIPIPSIEQSVSVNSVLKFKSGSSDYKYSSGTLSAPVDTAAAATTSTRPATASKAATDVGPSHPEESESSDDSFYEIPNVDPAMAKRWYVPKWNITNDSLLDDAFSCRTLVDRVAPPAFFSDLRTMGYDQLFTEFNVGAARQICLGSEVRSRTEHELELKEKLRAKYAARGKLLEERDLEILELKSKLAEKETEAAEAIRLRDQVSSLSGEKSALTAEVSALKVTIAQKDHDISLLDSHATSLASGLENAKVACTEAGDKIISLTSERDRLISEQEEQAQELYNRVAELEAHVMDVFGRLEGEFYPTYLTTLAGRRWLLAHGVQLALLKCLKSSEYQGILGHALGRAINFGMQVGLEAGHEHGSAGRSLSVVDAYNPEAAKANYIDAVKALEDVDFPLVNLLKSKKDAGMDEVLDCFLLDGPAADLPESVHLQPCLEQLTVPIHHAGDKTIVGETSLSFALMNVHNRAEGAKKHVAALRKLMIDIVSDPLSSQTWVGEASTSAAPLSVEDYQEEDTDEALGSVVAIPQLEVPYL